MLSGVSVWGVVTATHMAADLAKPKVNPAAAHLKAILATVRARRHLDDLLDVLTIFHM